MVFDIMSDVEYSQSLLFVATGQTFTIEDGQIDVAIHVVTNDLGMEHASNEVGLRSWPEEEFFNLIGLHLEGKSFIWEEIRHVLGEFKHVLLLLFVFFFMFTLHVIYELTGKWPFLLGCRADLVHRVEVSFKVYVHVVRVCNLLLGNDG